VTGTVLGKKAGRGSAEAKPAAASFAAKPGEVGSQRGNRLSRRRFEKQIALSLPPENEETVMFTAQLSDTLVISSSSLHSFRARLQNEVNTAQTKRDGPLFSRQPYSTTSSLRLTWSVKNSRDRLWRTYSPSHTPHMSREAIQQ